MNNSIFNDFVAHFATASITSLVESFNSQVGNRGFTSARAAHDVALIRDLSVVVSMCLPCTTASGSRLLNEWFSIISWRLPDKVIRLK